MTPEEFKAAIKALGLNNTTAGRWLARTRRTIIRYQYATDDPRNSKIPQPVADVIRYWLKERETRENKEGR